MGGRLRRKKKDMKRKKLSDGKTIGGCNRLTDNLIDIFQHYYGKALQQNKGNLPNMQKAVKLFDIIMPQLLRTKCMSTVLKEMIPGANGKRTRRMEQAPSNPKMLPTFEALWDENLL